ncbi:MAG: hypothetical protein FWE09_04355 [Treponema sp.]|nr:hypothetical protein [Treponema sp.]
MAILLATAAVPPAFSQGLDARVAQIVDDSQARFQARDAWLLGRPEQALAMPRTLRRLGSGEMVEIRALARPAEILVIFARQHPRTGAFTDWAQGSWEFTRDRASGAITNVRVFPRSDPQTFVQFRPFDEDRVQMDVILYDAYVARSQPLPISMERLAVAPLSDIIRLAGGRFPLRYFEPDPTQYALQKNFIEDIRRGLPELGYSDDGAIDHEGSFVHIATGLPQASGERGLNCSGFAKWLIDGMLRPITGRRLEIAPVAAPFGDRGSSFSDPFERSRDPFFGLDWVRNLAAEAGRELLGPVFGSLEEIEVRSQPFSQVILRRGAETARRPLAGFLPNAGHGIEGLLPLLYALAIDEPGRFFLGTVSAEMNAPGAPFDPRGARLMRQYFHVAALIPYFDESGVFRVAVFESSEETSINAFTSRYSLNHHVNLVRLPLPAVFAP